MKDKLIKNPTDVWGEKLNKLFYVQEDTVEQKFLNVVSIVLYGDDTNKDLAELFSLVDFDSFIKIINLFDGRTIKFPSKEEIKEAIEIALYYYYKEIKGVKTYQVLKDLNIRDKDDFSSIAIGRKINKIKDIVASNIVDALKEVEKQ